MILDDLPDPIAFKYKIFERVGYIPHPGQDQMHRSTARFRILAAAARVGKTYAAAHEVLAHALHPAGKVIWIVAPTMELSDRIFKVVEQLIYDPRQMWHRLVASKNKRDKEIILHNGSIIKGKSIVNPESLLGEGVDFMVCDEMSRFPHEIFWGYLYYRLLTTCGDFLAISTPYGRSGVFYDLWTKGQDPNEKEYESWMPVTIYDNPLIPKEALEQMRSQSKDNEIQFKREALGRFVDAQGDVFPKWDPRIFIGNIPYNPNLPVEATIDTGFRNAFSCLFLQRRGKHVRFFREYYKHGYTTVEAAKELKPLFELYGIERCVVDPREPNDRATLQHFIPSCEFVPGNDVNKQSIKLGFAVIRDHMVVEDDAPLIAFDKSMKMTIMEFSKIHYKPGDKEIPEGEQHSIAAIRYFLVRYCNFLDRTDASFMGAFGKREMFIKFMEDEHSSLVANQQEARMDFNERIWMGDYNDF